MKDKSLISRLKRYSTHAIGHALDEDFAEAVHDATVTIENLCDDLQEALDEINKLRMDKINCNLLLQTQKATLENCRNELCLKCGDYKMRHKGACDDCRWRDADG